MGNIVEKHNSSVLESLVRGDIIKVPGEGGFSYYLYSGDVSKLYLLNEETPEYFKNPCLNNEFRPTVTYIEAFGDKKCYRITESEWIYETEGKNVDVATYNKKFLQVLLPGDIALFSCHNVLYIGDGMVIHLVSSLSTCARLTAKHKKELAAIPFAKGLVTKDAFLDLSKKKKAFKNNRRDMFGFVPEKIIKRAEDQLGPATFSFLTQNCWHFVQEMKYGWQVCKKIRSFRIGKDPSALVDEGGFSEVFPALSINFSDSEPRDSRDINLQEVSLDTDVEEDDFVVLN